MMAVAMLYPTRFMLVYSVLPVLAFSVRMNDETSEMRLVAA